MPHAGYAVLSLAVLIITCNVSAQETTRLTDPSKTTYGERNPGAPQELGVFSFLVGKWDGKGKTRLENGTFAEFAVTWIGRMDVSNDGGKSWNEGQIEMTFRRSN